MDREKIMEGVRLILDGIGEDVTREGLLETPERVAKMYEELAGGYTDSASTHLAKRFDVELTSAGSSKIKVVKAVKEATGLGLKDAKELVDGAPKVIKEALPKEEAEKLKEQLEEVGATVELK